MFPSISYSFWQICSPNRVSPKRGLVKKPKLGIFPFPQNHPLRFSSAVDLASLAHWLGCRSTKQLHFVFLSCFISFLTHALSTAVTLCCFTIFIFSKLEFIEGHYGLLGFVTFCSIGLGQLSLLVSFLFFHLIQLGTTN